MRQPAWLYKQLNHSCGLQIPNGRVVPVIGKFVFDSLEKSHLGIYDYFFFSYGMELVDSLRYKSQSVGILIILTHTRGVCVYKLI